MEKEREKNRRKQMKRGMRIRGEGIKPWIRLLLQEEKILA